MNKNRAIFYFFICIALGGFCYFYTWNNKTAPYLHTEKITRFTQGGIPCVPIQLGNVTVELEFDCGFRGDLLLDHDILDPLTKTFLKESISYGVRGKSYQEKVYSLPQAKIAGVVFKHPEVKEGAREFYQDAILSTNPRKTPIRIRPGSIGWTLFSSLNLLIDVPHLKIGTCDSVETLLNQGYFENGYVMTPLLQNKPYIGIEILGSSGPLQCFFDSGATVCILNSETEGNDFQTETIQIAGNDFGPLDFYPFPMKLPNAPGAALGMNFLSKHTVFIDFKRQMVYISLV
jgi:hypothetical protein